jgi:iron complex outermembrane receptor protein
MRLEVPVSVNRKDSSMDMESWYSFADTVIDGLKIMPQLVMDGDLSGKANKLICGVDFSIDDLEVDRYADKSRGSANTSACVQENIIGFYARDEFTAAEDLTLALGGRVEQAEIKADVNTLMESFVDSETHNENAVDLSVTQLIDKKVKVYARGSTVYRYPFVDEQVSYIGYGSDQFYNDIDPEEGWSVEAGAESRITDNLTAGISAFIIAMEDEIAWNAVTMRNENLDDTQREGLEANVAYTPVKQLTLDASYTYMELAEFVSGQYDGNQIPLVPTHKISAGMMLLLPADVTLDLTATYTGASYMGGDSSNEGPKLSSYTVADMYLRHKVLKLKGLEVYAGVKNLFDEEYASLAYKGYMEDGYYPSPDRTFLAGASYKF